MNYHFKQAKDRIDEAIKALKETAPKGCDFRLCEIKVKDGKPNWFAYCDEMISRHVFNQVRVLLGALLVLGAAVLILKAAPPDPMKMSDDELFKLVNGSTFTFIGTIK